MITINSEIKNALEAHLKKFENSLLNQSDLDESGRQQVIENLREQILDMLEKRSSTPTRTDLENVLLEIDRPEAFQKLPPLPKTTMNERHRTSRKPVPAGWIFLLCLAISGLYGIYLISNKVDEYVAEGRIMVQPSTVPADPAGEEMSRFLQTQREMMESTAISEAAKANLSDYAKSSTSHAIPPRVKLQVDSFKGTSIFRITATGTNRDYTIRFVDEVIKVYIAKQKEISQATGRYPLITIHQKAAASQHPVGPTRLQIAIRSFTMGLFLTLLIILIWFIKNSIQASRSTDSNLR
jgi:capsular polysaccharide biosynthesis protein